MRPHPALSLFLFTLAGCGAVPDSRPTQRAGQSTGASPVTVARPEARQCFAELGETGSRFAPLPDKYYGAGCSTVNSVRLEGVGGDRHQFTVTNLGATSSSIITVVATPTAGYGMAETNASVELRVTSTSLSEDGGLLTILNAKGLGWVVGVVALFLIIVLVFAVMLLRRTEEPDAGEDILFATSGALGNVEQRREAALDTGPTPDDLVSGGVSDKEIAAAIAESSIGPAPGALPPPPGKAPPPVGAPPPPAPAAR